MRLTGTSFLSDMGRVGAIAVRVLGESRSGSGAGVCFVLYEGVRKMELNFTVDLISFLGTDVI